MTSPYPPSTKTATLSILLLSDTHSTTLLPKTFPLPPTDILIHAGDLTTTSTFNEHLSTFSLLASSPAPLKLVIPGNHDLTLDADYWLSGKKPAGYDFGLGEANKGKGAEERKRDVEKVRELWMGKKAREKGIMFLEGEGLHVIPIPVPDGSKERGKGEVHLKVWASPFTPAFCGWAFAYPRTEDRFNAPHGKAPIPDFPGVDIVVTHGPPKGVLDLVVGGPTGDTVEAGCESLARATERVRPRLHVFGHIHEGYGVLRMDWGRGVRVRKGTGRGEQEEEVEVRRIDISEGGGKGMGDGKEGGGGVDGPLRWGEETLFVNAAIMNVDYEPLNAPWVVKLDLPIVDEE